MRIGAAWVPCSNANYRVIDPLMAMARRGHEVVWPATNDGAADLHRLASCDVVHVYRRADDQTCRVLSQLARSGVGITFDNDDDLTAIPKESPDYKKYGGLIAQRLWAMSVKAARMAGCFTTTNEALAARYRGAGVQRIEVIGNRLDPTATRIRRPHDGIVVGWIAGIEHQADVARIDIVGALTALLDKREDLRVESIGVDLRLSERYRHDAHVPFRELPARIGGFDIGIAPLAAIRCNRTRSDIKLKEYAASSVPWLASPVGPYIGLGEAEGGRLVPDAEWLDALDHLVTDTSERQRLADNAGTWARGQTIDAVAGQWEQIFARAARPEAARRPAMIGRDTRRAPLPSGMTVRLASSARGRPRRPRT